MRERELKPLEPPRGPCGSASLPMRERELKLMVPSALSCQRVSLPMRERELKRSFLRSSWSGLLVAPHAGA